jgi:hypothetical protein
MPVLSIQYDLYKEPGRVYDELIEAIKAYGSWCHPTESSWLIQTSSMPKEVFEYLKPHLHAKDKLLVSPVALDAGWWAGGLPDKVMEWLRTSLSTSRVS